MADDTFDRVLDDRSRVGTDRRSHSDASADSRAAVAVDRLDLTWYDGRAPGRGLMSGGTSGPIWGHLAAVGRFAARSAVEAADPHTRWGSGAWRQVGQWQVKDSNL